MSCQLDFLVNSLGNREEPLWQELNHHVEVKSDVTQRDEMVGKKERNIRERSNYRRTLSLYQMLSDAR